MWRHPTAYQQELGRVQISTMCVKRNLLVAGGFQGEMVCKVRAYELIALPTWSVMLGHRVIYDKEIQ
jgi:hypothetical protein